MHWITLLCNSFWSMFLDMSFYMMLGLLFVGLFHAYVKKEQVLKHLGKEGFGSVIKAALVGVPLPLCSCGVVPTAVELKKSGASNGAVISFLISTPQTGVDSIFATYCMMGFVMAIFRPIAAFVSGILGGAVIDCVAKNEVINTETSCACCCHAKEEAQAASACCCHAKEEVPVPSSCCHSKEKVSPKQSKFLQVFTYAYGGFLDEIAPHFVLGMALAALITAFIPADLFVRLGLNEGILAMICMVLIGLPMYICSVSSIPIALALITKGLSLGSAFVFLFTGPVTNIASLLVLRKTLGQKITGLYVSCVVVCSLVFGLVLDLLVHTFDLSVVRVGSMMHAGMEHASPLHYVVALVFGLLLVKSFVLRFVQKRA